MNYFVEERHQRHQSLSPKLECNRMCIQPHNATVSMRVFNKISFDSKKYSPVKVNGKQKGLSGRFSMHRRSYTNVKDVLTVKYVRSTSFIG